MNDLEKELIRHLGEKKVSTDDLTLVASAADAGCYRKIPQIVLKPENEAEVARTLSLLHRKGISVTFRAAGTSLSGQSISDSVLLQARGDHWAAVEVLDGGKRVKTGPGVTGSRLNQVLLRHGVKFGPDPASVNSAMVGGIIANNASGMSCGIHANAYSTLESARIIFADGSILDTANSESREQFLKEKDGLVGSLQRIRDSIMGSPELLEKIKRKYSIKNTTGYGMNSLVDYEDPIDMVLHLMVGSEGTLGFISEAVFRTVVLKAFRASSLVFFSSLEEACNAVPALREIGLSAIEIMDREALRSVENNPGIPAYLKDFGTGVSALLIDLETESEEALEGMIAGTEKALAAFRLEREFEVTHNPSEIATYWNVRKGVFPSVGGMRKPGTSVIIEDVAVGPEHLTEAVSDIRSTLDELGFSDAVIYGHVLDGNLHFIFSQDFQAADALEKYERMIRAITTLIVEKYDGSLKAEHGTGLNMAPFVAYEWGEVIYAFMKEIKDAFDPLGILNPDVLISGDPDIFMKDFKPMPVIDESVDACIECGFCEINCLSNGFSLSARQRIVVQREIRLLRESGENQERLRNLIKAFQYAGNESCAGDGLCATSCPLSIDTGVLIKKMRAQAHAEQKSAQLLSRWVGRNFRSVHALVETGLGMATMASAILPFNKIWIWDRHMPRPARYKRPTPSQVQKEPGTVPRVVYFPSCINQSMGTSVKDKEKRPLIKVTVEVLEKAGYEVIFPERMNRLCCGTPWESKGFTDMADAKSSELEAALLEASSQGEIPILVDTSPCLYRMRRVMDPRLKMHEPVEFINDFLLDRLELHKVSGRQAFHITCTSTKMGLEDKFRRVAEACCDDPVFPEQVGCCGFAGDKGFTLPELNSWSLRHLKVQVQDLEAGYSNSRTCEIGLSRNSGIDYRSIFYLLDKAMQ